MNIRAVELVILISFTLGVGQGLAQPVVDQQQPIIESPGFTYAVDGTFVSRVAQVVTVGTAGSLSGVRLPIGCADDHSGYLVVEIQGVTAGGEPDGLVLTSESVSGAALPPLFPGPPAFRDVAFSAPVTFLPGERFAFVLSTSQACGVSPGPIGDPYPGGDAYFAGLPADPSLWRSGCTSSVPARCDIPFQTLVGDPLVCSSDVTSTGGLRVEVADLSTSIASMDVLNALLDQVDTALTRARHPRARRRLERMIRELVNRSNLDASDPDHIPREEGNHLVCGTSNVLIGVPLP